MTAARVMRYLTFVAMALAVVGIVASILEHNSNAALWAAGCFTWTVIAALLQSRQ